MKNNQKKPTKSSLLGWLIPIIIFTIFFVFLLENFPQ